MFHLRNPTALQDDFWSILINVWISAFSCISQIVYHFMPGREGIDIYICSGRFPLHHLNTPVKINYPAVLTVVLSVIIHLSFAILTSTLKHCVRDKFSKYENYKIHLIFRGIFFLKLHFISKKYFISKALKILFCKK